MNTHQDIVNRIRRWGRGSVFTPRDFLDLGSRDAVDQALYRLAQDEYIRRLDHGLYDYPQISPRVGPRSPDPDDVADALARRTGARVQRAGAAAAHALGLSLQVPARPVYLTDGPSRAVNAGNRTVTMRHAATSRLVGAGTVSGDFLQAIKFLGKEALDDTMAKSLRDRLDADQLRKLNADAVAFPAWIQRFAMTVTVGV